MIAERGLMAWRKASGYNLRAKVEASISRYKRVIGDAPSIAYGPDRGDRGRPRHGGSEPDVGVRTPEPCPYLANNILGWGNCVPAPSCLISTQHSRPRRKRSAAAACGRRWVLLHRITAAATQRIVLQRIERAPWRGSIRGLQVIPTPPDCPRGQGPATRTANTSGGHRYQFLTRHYRWDSRTE